MTEIWFYHLTDSTLEQALPGLVERSLGRGWNVVVQTGSDERRDALDALLWTFRDDSFVPHGTDAAFGSDSGELPVLLTTTERNENAASIRFLVDGAAVPSSLDGYERMVLMFDGHDADQLAQAREAWKALKDSDHSVTYWQQGEGGRWEKKA